MSARVWMLLISLSCLWGGTFFAVAIALREVPPMTLVLARCVIAACVLLPIVAALKMSLPRTAMEWRDFLMMSLLNNIIPFSLIFYAQQTVPSALASVLNATTPLMSLIVLRTIAGEAMTANKIAGVLIGLFGVAVLVGPDAVGGARLDQVVGMFAILGATLSYGLSGLWGRRLSATAPPVSAAAQMICSTLLMLPIAAGLESFWTLAVPSRQVMAAVLSLGVLSTALAYILFFEILRTSGPLNVMLVTLLVPFTATALGTLVLGETLSMRQVAGALFIGVSLLVIDGRLMARLKEHAAAKRLRS